VERAVSDADKIAELTAEIVKLKEWVDLHRGDTLSLDNDVRIMMEQRDEAEARCRELEGVIDALEKQRVAYQKQVGAQIAGLLAEIDRLSVP
jgi:uncharacterized coiled-coil DUF342 family protein